MHGLLLTCCVAKVTKQKFLRRLVARSLGKYTSTTCTSSNKCSSLCAFCLLPLFACEQAHILAILDKQTVDRLRH